MIIVLTGCVGTGKTSVAKILSKELRMQVINDKEFCIANKIGTMRGDELEVDISQLQDKILAYISDKNTILEGHLFSLVKLPADTVFVLHTRIDELEQRLRERGYSAEKIHENILTEGIDYCKEQAKLHYACKICDIDTTHKTVEEVALKIKKILEGKETCDKINHETELVNYLRRK